jgi:hypothetical protein
MVISIMANAVAEGTQHQARVVVKRVPELMSKKWHEGRSKLDQPASIARDELPIMMLLSLVPTRFGTCARKCAIF